MDEKYIQDLYDHLGGETKFGKFDDFKHMISTDDKYRKDFFDSFGEKQLGKYDDFDVLVKKKSVGEVGSTPLGTGVSKNQDTEIPVVDISLPDDFSKYDPIELSRQHHEFKDAVIDDNGAYAEIGGGSTEPDVEKRNKAKGIEGYLKGEGIDNPEKLYEETKGLTDTDFGIQGFSKEKLLSDRKENYNSYLRGVGRLKWRGGLEKALADNLIDANISKDDYDNILASVKSSINSLNNNVGSYQQQRDNARNISFFIKQYAGDKAPELLKSYASEMSKVYGNAYKTNFSEYAKTAPESEWLDNDALLGYEYLKDIAPDKAKQYESLFIDPKKLKNDPDALSAYNKLMLNLKEVGLSLQRNAVNEDLNGYVRVSKSNDGLTPEQLQETEKLQNKLTQLDQQENKLDADYPERQESIIDDATQEILGQKTGWASQIPLRAKNAVKNTVSGVWEMVSEPFMSDESNQRRELAIMGEAEQQAKDTRRTDENTAFQTSRMEFDPELKKQLDAIANDKTLTYGQQEDKIHEILKANKGKFGRVEIANGKLNLSPSAIVGAVTDLGTSLLPFIAIEAATGGIGGAGASAKFLRTANAAFLSGYHDHYAEALQKGYRGSDAYFHAMGMTAIDAAVMAGAQTPEAIRNFYKGKNISAAKVIDKLSDEALQQGIDRGLTKGLKSFGQSVKERIKATPNMLAKGARAGAEFELASAAGEQLKVAINNENVNPKEQAKRAVLGIINFSAIGAALGHAGYKSPHELDKSYLVDIGKQPEGYTAALEKMRKDGDISQSSYEEKKFIIEKAQEAYRSLPKYNSKGKQLTETQKGDYLLKTIVKQEHEQGKNNLPPKQAEDAEKKSKVADYERQFILDEPTDKQLQSEKEKIEKQLSEKDEEGKLVLPEKEQLELQAKKEAIENVIEERTKNEQPLITVEPPKEIPEPTTIKIENEPIQEGTESTKPISTEEGKPTEAAVVEEGTGAEKVSGVKKAIIEPTRAANNLPKVELPPMGADTEMLEAAKKRVDEGAVDPQKMVESIMKENRGYRDEDEVMDMQYYAHQLNKKSNDLTRKIADASTEEEKTNLRSQQMQLNDVIDAQTTAARIAGNKWGKIGNKMQPVISDAGQIFRDNKQEIQDAYGGEIPKEVKEKMDALTKERDNALVEKALLEKELVAKMAIKGFEEIKKSAEKQSKIKQSKEELKKEEEDLLKQLKDEWKNPAAEDNNIIKNSISPITDKMVVLVGKLAINYAKQGIRNLELLVDKIHTQLSAASLGFTKDQVREMIANYNEVERLNKKAEILENKIQPSQLNNKGVPQSTNPDVNILPKVRPTFERSTEWVKATQRVADAEFKMKILKRKALESQKNMYQRALMWLGRLTRLSVLSGYNVLGKLASAATIGSLGKRPIEQSIGAFYSKVFKGIAEKAPIEGYWNAKAEAKFYKEFFNPKKFGKNAWEILKTGSSPLSRKLGSAEYEHVPGLYLPTDLHQIIKDPPKRATFEASFINGLVWAEKNGLDINDPLVINSIENAAYKRAQYEIFQEQNWLSKKFTSYKSSLEKNGNIGATGKFLVDFLIPVSTVPTNIVRRIVTTSPLGLIRGSKEVVDAYRKGIENLKPDEANHVMQQLKQGSLGTALWLIGWFGASQFGGLYSKFNPNKKRDEGELMSDEMMVGGKMIPKPTQHALPLEIIQMAATARHIYDKSKEDEKSTPEAIYNAGMGAIGAGLEQIPVVETPVHLVNAASNPYEAGKLEEDMMRRVQPQILRETGIIPKEEKNTGHKEKAEKKTKKEKPERVH